MTHRLDGAIAVTAPRGKVIPIRRIAPPAEPQESLAALMSEATLAAFATLFALAAWAVALLLVG